MANKSRSSISVVVAMVLLATLFLVAACAGQPQPQPHDSAEVVEMQVEYQGVWEGSLEVQGQQLPIIVKFLSDPSAGPNAHARMSIPVQNAYGLPLSNVRADGAGPGSTVHFELVVGGPPFIADVVVSEDGALSGPFTQGPASGSIRLVRTADLDPEDTPAVRPAEPVLGTSTEVSIQTGGATLRGTMLVPDTELPAPLVVILAGSGPTDRDGNSMLYPGPNNSLKSLAERLAGRGIATLRYDKRGIAESAYPEYREDLPFEIYVNDLLEWASWAGEREEVREVFLAGHSEGGLAVMAALGADPAPDAESDLDANLARSVRRDISGAILLAAPGRSLDVVTLAQLEESAGLMSTLYAQARDIVARLREGEDVADVPSELVMLFRPSVQPYLRSLFRFDPAALAAAIDVPLLVIGGTEDIQVPVSDARIIAESASHSEMVIVERMNHVLKMVTPGDLESNRQSYYDPSFELSGEVVNSIADFVLGD